MSQPSALVNLSVLKNDVPIVRMGRWQSSIIWV